MNRVPPKWRKCPRTGYLQYKCQVCGKWENMWGDAAHTNREGSKAVCRYCGSAEWYDEKHEV